MHRWRSGFLIGFADRYAVRDTQEPHAATAFRGPHGAGWQWACGSAPWWAKWDRMLPMACGGLIAPTGSMMMQDIREIVVCIIFTGMVDE